MNDFDYENLQKKRVAAGAARMKRGSKSKKCTLLSDYLTPAQIKQKHGEVKTMNMNQPVLWADFKEWPEDLQKEYLEHRMKDFDCTMAGLAEILNIDVSTLRKTLVKIDFDMSRFVVGRKMTKENRERMMDWIKTVRPDVAYRKATKSKPAHKTSIGPDVKIKDEDAAMKAPSAETTPTVELVETATQVEPLASPASVEREHLMKTPFIKMDFLGKLNPMQITNTLLALAKGEDVRVSMTIEYREGC